jgi:glycosyltransferase involved in cell wall biosynthesis
MKIMYLARRPVPSVNANSVQIVKMCEAFAALGHRVTLVAHPGDAAPETTFERYGVVQDFKIETHPKSGRTLAKWRYLLALQPTARRIGPDLFFGRDIWSLVSVARMGKPLIYEAHVLPPRGSPRWRLLCWLFGQPNFSHLVCVTTTLAERYRDQFPALRDKPVIIAPNAAAQIQDDGATVDWPGRSGSLQVGFVGRPFRGKGVELLVRAARELPEVDFHVIGAERHEISWVDGELPANVHFHGYQPHHTLGRFYRHMDVAVAPYGTRVMNASGVESAAITSPLKLIEYLAAGLPTVVSDLPGVRDMLGGSHSSLLVPPGDLPAFVAALQQLTDPRLRESMSIAARDEYLRRHTAESRARRVLGGFADLVERSEGKRHE